MRDVVPALMRQPAQECGRAGRSADTQPCGCLTGSHVWGWHDCRLVPIPVRLPAGMPDALDLLKQIMSLYVPNSSTLYLLSCMVVKQPLIFLKPVEMSQSS